MADGVSVDIVQQLRGDAMHGSMADGYGYDVALPLRGDTFNGSLADLYLALDNNGVIIEYLMYGDSFLGSMSEGRLPLDRDEGFFRRYWTESDWQIGGSAIGESQTGTSVESEGSV